MSSIVVHPTSTAQWHALIGEAEQSCQHYLSENSESYLVFLLMRFVTYPEIAHSILGLDFLASVHKLSGKRLMTLRDVGDKCLLLAGLFPERALRRQVSMNYFVDLGQNAYQSLSDEVYREASLFTGLAADFIPMRNVLNSTREISENPADGLWHDLLPENLVIPKGRH